MEKYRRQYPDADILLFEPEREDADMFFASTFSYAHRKRLCEIAYRTTRQSLASRGRGIAASLAKHRIRIDFARLGDPQRPIEAALDDVRPLMMHAPEVGRAARERWLAAAAS